MGSMVTSVLSSCWSWSRCTDTETFARCLGTPRLRLPPWHQRGSKDTSRAGTLLAPAWSRSSWLTSGGSREVYLAFISPPLASLPCEAAPEEVLHRPPREAWPLTKVLNALLMKMGRTCLLAKPRHGPQAGKSGHPRSRNTDSAAQRVSHHNFPCCPCRAALPASYLLA